MMHKSAQNLVKTMKFLREKRIFVSSSSAYVKIQIRYFVVWEVKFMLNLNKPIPKVAFPTNRLPVGAPSLEEMVYLDDIFICDSMYYHWVEDGGKPVPGSSPRIMVRKTICEMLKKAEAMLPAGLKFKIYDAYRPIAVQQALYNYVRAQKAAENPGKTEAEIDAITLLCVSFPSYNVMLPSLHNTGGAVDLTIVDEKGNELDMGCGFDEFTDKAWANFYEPDSGFEGNDTNEAARDNRRMLYNIMMEAGFTNFPSEWWHFDYGDEKWGLISKNSPIYAGNLDAGLKDAVPYAHQQEVIEANKKQQELVKQIAELRSACEKIDAEVSKLIKE